MQRSFLVRLRSWLVPGAFALILVLLGVAGSWAPPAPSAAAPGPGGAAAPAVTCTPAWDPVPAASAPAESFLYSLAPVATNDIWAAGKAWVYPADPLVEHWDGAAWSAVPFPTVVPGHDH